MSACTLPCELWGDLVSGNKNFVQSCLSPEVPFRWFFPQPWLVSSQKCPDQHSAEASRWTLCKPPVFSPLWSCALYTLATLTCLDSFQLRVMARVYLDSSVPTSQAGNSLKALIWGSLRSHLICFPSQGSLPCNS